MQLGNCGSPIETDAAGLYLRTALGRYGATQSVLSCWTSMIPVVSLGGYRSHCSSQSRRSVMVTCRTSYIAAERWFTLASSAYAMSDQCTSFATVPLDELLSELKSQPPESPR